MQELENSAAEAAAIIAKWQESFLNLDPHAQQDTLFAWMCDRLYWRILHYIRQYPEKLTSSAGTYSDRCVGSEEFMALMGLPEQPPLALEWLKKNRVPEQEEIDRNFALVHARIDAVLEKKDELRCPIAQIMRDFDLSNIELEILATIAIPLGDENFVRLLAVAWADFSVRQPTVSFVCRLLGDGFEGFEHVYGAFSEHGTLRRMRLIILEKHALYPNCTPVVYAPIAMKPQVIDAFRGRMHDHDISPHMTLHTQGLALKKLILDKSWQDELSYAVQTPGARICLLGIPHSGRRTAACAVVQARTGKNVLEVDVCRELEHAPDGTLTARFADMLCEALLNNCLLLLRFDGLRENEEICHRLMSASVSLSRLMAQCMVPLIILATHYERVFEDIFSKPTCLHWAIPSVDQACDVWTKALSPCSTPEEAQHMASMFSRNYALPIGGIFLAVRSALETNPWSDDDLYPIRSHHILNEIRRGFRHQLGDLAEITVSDVPLSRVVLPESAQSKVDEILRYANSLHTVLDDWGFRACSPYGNALSVLFSGPPGTGKTLLACALANELGKVLYRVDLSRIVDKYVGETEKNLNRIFDEAAKAQAIILFDEADALFAKRTDVKSSNDRYANLESNFLLQKLESYNGVTILTTNLAGSIDEAFRRRLRFILEFPMPDVEARVHLWQHMMPPQAPIDDDIRWKWLARTFEMSGGYIRNAVLKAAVEAASEHKPISMAHLARAAADEARSMGTLMRITDIDMDDFDDYDDPDDEWR